MARPTTVHEALNAHYVRVEVGHDAGQSALQFVRDCEALTGQSTPFTQSQSHGSIWGHSVQVVDMPQIQDGSVESWMMHPVTDQDALRNLQSGKPIERAQ